MDTCEFGSQDCDLKKITEYILKNVKGSRVKGPVNFNYWVLFGVDGIIPAVWSFECDKSPLPGLLTFNNPTDGITCFIMKSQSAHTRTVSTPPFQLTLPPPCQPVIGLSHAHAPSYSPLENKYCLLTNTVI